MIHIVIYNEADGDIIRCTSCPMGMQDIQCGNDEAWIEHERVDDTLFKVDLSTLEIVPVS